MTVWVSAEAEAGQLSGGGHAVCPGESGCVGGPRLVPMCLDLRLRSQQEEETQKARQGDQNKACAQEREIERGCKTCTLNIWSRRCGTGGGWGPAAEWPVAKVMATRAPLRRFSQAGLRGDEAGPNYCRFQQNTHIHWAGRHTLVWPLASL